MVHRMIWNQTAFFGPGAINEIPGELSARGFHKALVVSDQVLVDSGVTERVTKLLDGAGFPYELFTDVAPNPPIENVKAGVAAFKAAKADVLIAIGGGSPQDTCKAIGIIIENPEFSDVRSLEGVAATKEALGANRRSSHHCWYGIGNDHQLRNHRYRAATEVRLRGSARHSDFGRRRSGNDVHRPACLKGCHRT